VDWIWRPDSCGAGHRRECGGRGDGSLLLVSIAGKRYNPDLRPKIPAAVVALCIFSFPPTSTWRTASREVGALACLLHAYHGSSAGLVFNSGTCYDVCCFSFYLAAFTSYMRIRQQGSVTGPTQTALRRPFHHRVAIAKSELWACSSSPH